MFRRSLTFVICLSSFVLPACENDPRAVALRSPDGGDASVPGEAGPEGGDGAVAPYPLLLSQTGLYASIKPEVLAAGVRAFEPKYALWSDGALKRRWISLPAGQQIDTSDMDFWKYPVGTRVWKEFSTLGGATLETRMLFKAGPAKSDWVMIAYQWNQDGSDAVAVPDGVQNTGGTQHDIPDQATCHTCHDNMQDVLLGFSALQLSHTLPGLNLSGLVSDGALTTNPPSAGFTIPGGPVAEKALGYLHANCGLCHNSKAPLAVTIGMTWWESVSSLATLQTTTGFTTGVGQPTTFQSLNAIEPRSSANSAIIRRMSSRQAGIQMPPVGTEQVDPSALADVAAFIDSLPSSADGGPSDGGPDGGALDGG